MLEIWDFLDVQAGFFPPDIPAFYLIKFTNHSKMMILFLVLI